MNIYDFSVDKINGEFTSLREYEGKVILIVNSATRCGFTPQYDELEEHPLTAMLESKFERENPNYKNEPDIKWNFTKFLVDRSGKGVARFEPTADFDKIKKEIEKLL